MDEKVPEELTVQWWITSEFSWPTPFSVSERLPIDGDDVLVSIALSNGFSYWTVAFFSDDDWWVDAPDGATTTADERVTHWLPLPPDPEVLHC